MGREIMRVDATTVPCQPRRHRVYKPRPKRYDGRGKTAKRVKKLMAGYAERLGAIAQNNPIVRADLLRLAELETLAESSRAAALRREPIDLALLARIENTARRLRIALGLDGPPPPPPLPATLEEMLNE